MKNVTRLTLTALVLLTGVSAAAANGKSKAATTGSASPMSQSMTKDTLSLSAGQQKTAWKDISGQAVKETAPVTFTAKVGAAVPSDLGVKAVPASTADKVPALRPYQYALLDTNKLLIVNPSDHKIAEVIAQ